VTRAAVLVVAVLAGAGCAAHGDVDPNRVFRYGELQREGDRFVLVEQSLEDGEVRDLVIMDDVPDDTEVCLEVAAPRHREVCLALGRLRQLLESR
jgi:hypothetical protein